MQSIAPGASNTWSASSRTYKIRNVSEFAGQLGAFAAEKTMPTAKNVPHKFDHAGCWTALLPCMPKVIYAGASRDTVLLQRAN